MPTRRASPPSGRTVRLLPTGVVCYRLHAANVLLWRRIVVAAGNVAYLLAFNTLVAHAYAIAPVPAAHRTDELLDTGGHLQLAEFIANGYSDDAERLARHLLSCSAAAAAQEVRAVEGKG